MKLKIFILLIVLSTTIIAEDPRSIELTEGKNVLIIEDYFPAFSVSMLIEQYPQIQSVSMEEYGQVFGYVNTFGGIGTDFIIRPSQTYEIHVEKDITINLVS